MAVILKSQGATFRKCCDSISVEIINVAMQIRNLFVIKMAKMIHFHLKVNQISAPDISLNLKKTIHSHS